MKIKFNLIVFFMALIVHYQASAGITRLDGSTQGTQVSSQVQLTSRVVAAEDDNLPKNINLEISLENIMAKTARGAIVKIQPVYIDSFYCFNSSTKYGPAYISNGKVIVRATSGTPSSDRTYLSSCVVRFLGNAKLNSGDEIKQTQISTGNTTLDATCNVLNVKFESATTNYSAVNAGRGYDCRGQKYTITDSAIHSVSDERPPVSITGTAYTPDSLTLKRGENKELLRWTGTGPVNYFVTWSVPDSETVRLIDKSGSVITNQRGILNDGESVYLEYSGPNIKGVHTGFASVGLELR